MPRLPDEVMTEVHDAGITDAQLNKILRTFLIHSRDGVMERQQAFSVMEEAGFKNPQVMEAIWHLLDERRDGKGVVVSCSNVHSVHAHAYVCNCACVCVHVTPVVVIDLSSA